MRILILQIATVSGSCTFIIDDGEKEDIKQQSNQGLY